MKYETLSVQLKEIPQIIELNKEILQTIDGQKKNLLKKSTHKNLIIEIYTFWENYTKSTIYTCYKNYKKIIVDREFLVRYLEGVHEKSYTRQLFFENITDNKINITKENLCYSNNLNYNQLLDLFKRIGFDKNDFNKHIEGNPKIIGVLEELKREIIPVFQNTEREKQIKDYIQSYLDMIVEERNKVAHQYEIDDLYSPNQFELLLTFISVLSEVVFEYCSSQLIKKSLEKNVSITQFFQSLMVIKGNSRESSAIVGVESISDSIYSKDDTLFCYDRSKDIYRVLNIEKVIVNNEEVEAILPNSKCSIEVRTLSKINKDNPDFKICSLNTHADEFEYALLI